MPEEPFGTSVTDENDATTPATEDAGASEADMPMPPSDSLETRERGVSGYFDGADGSDAFGSMGVVADPFGLGASEGGLGDPIGNDAPVIDANGNPLIDSELKILGQATPDYILNFGFNFRYKGFRLAAVGDYRTGHQFFSGIKRQLSGQGRTFDTTFNDRQPFVFPNSTVEGSGVTNTTVLTAGGGNLQPLGEAYAYYTGDHNNIDENFIVDATAFKLREVSLTYDFSTKIVESLNLSRLSVGVSGRNLLTILPKSNLDYNDPEFAGRFGLATYGITPPTRYYTFNVNLSF
mgnify:CR=1 FL=1